VLDLDVDLEVVRRPERTLALIKKSIIKLSFWQMTLVKQELFNFNGQ
jgi:hypothetical protein